MSTGGALLTSFVGRRRELAEAKQAMADSRLVTLTGPGGVGKTRVAVELAERARRAFRDGVWTVELAPLERTTSRANLEATILEALGSSDQSNRSTADKLHDHLRDRHALLVVDNCEHVLEPIAAVVADLLAAAPSVRVLATSREALGIAGEQVRRIPPLATPSPDEQHRPEELERFDSVALLLHRARAVDPALAITAENAEAVVALCHRLDGIPLAIELAATRLRSLSITQVVERLDQRFALLTGGSRTALPRQQTLRALIDWSAELCSDAERLLWARLSVFPGGFDLDAAESVCGGEPLGREAVLDVLDQLVAKSLVGLERDGELVRYRLLMIVREYGAELLDELGGRRVLKRRHRDHYLQRAAEVVRTWAGPGQAHALAGMRREHANLVAALEFSAQTEGEAEAGLELASLLRYHWLPGGSLAVGRRWLERLLALTEGDSVLRGDAEWVLAWICLIQGDRDGAALCLRRCATIARSLGDDHLAAHVAHWSGLHAMLSGRPAEAAVLFDTARRRHDSEGDTASSLTALFMRSFALSFGGRPDEALESSRRGLETAKRLDERWTPTYLHWTMAVCHFKRGELDLAEGSARTGLAFQHELGEPICTAVTTETLAWIAAARGDFDRAAELAYAARGLLHALGSSMRAFGPHVHADGEACEQTFSARVASRRLQELRTRFATVTRDEVLELALGRGRPASVSAGEGAGGLTKRELEIAALVADGMSNREVAETLVISRRTVDGHVEHILAKLDFTSRTQVAAWMAARTTGAAR